MVLLEGPTMRFNYTDCVKRMYCTKHNWKKKHGHWYNTVQLNHSQGTMHFWNTSDPPGYQQFTKFVMTGGRGALIVFEGCDKVGKTTQCKKLVDKLLDVGIVTKYINFPDRSTPTGKLIDAYLASQQEVADKAIHLLFSANRWEQQSAMVSLLAGGCTLIVDRYSYSGVAFSAAKQNMDFEWCKAPEAGLPKPDAVFFLSLNLEAAAKREAFGLERYERPKFQEKVWQNYMALRDDSWQIMDSSVSIEELHQQLVSKTLEVIDKVKNLPVNQLW